MNQFKKAKEKAVASGHKPEKIADLMTAGVKAPKEETKETQPDTKEDDINTVVSNNETTAKERVANNEEIVKEVTVQETSSPNEPVLEVPVVQKVTSSPQTIEDSVKNTNDKSTIQDISTNNNTISNTSNNTANISQSEQNTEIRENIVSTINIEENTSIQNQAATINPQIVEDVPLQTNAPSNIPSFANTYNYIEKTGQVTSSVPLSSVQGVPVIEEPHVPIQESVPIPVPVSVQPNMQMQTVSVRPDNMTFSSQQTTENVVSTPVPAAPIPEPAHKKKMPNIFAPKEEAKSMRKSLVLKPTSVKKAESYCSKNGGSFNELIQTLLDNFIEEYDL